MTRLLLAAMVVFSIGAGAGMTVARQALSNGQPGPNLPTGKAPDQGYVPDGWAAHEGGLLKYRVQIRFGEEPDTMPDGFKFANDGTLLQTWGTKGVSGTDDKTFNRPTDIAWDSQGNFYISDGYGNSRVVKFDKAGRYVTAWGTPGDGPGQFRVVHSIAIDSHDRLYVSDRENNRIQIFDVSGRLIKTWTHLGCTQGIFITPKDEMWVITHRNNTENITYDTLAGRLMKLELETGRILGSMESPGHELTVAADGAIYVASLTGNIFKWSPDARWPQRAAK